jgi:hypothetical protein
MKSFRFLRAALDSVDAFDLLVVAEVAVLAPSLRLDALLRPADAGPLSPPGL